MVQTSAVGMLLWLPGTQSAGRIWIISHEYDWGWWWWIKDQPKAFYNHAWYAATIFRQPISWSACLPRSTNSINHPMHQYSTTKALWTYFWWRRPTNIHSQHSLCSFLYPPPKYPFFHSQYSPDWINPEPITLIIGNSIELDCLSTWEESTNLSTTSVVTATVVLGSESSDGSGNADTRQVFKVEGLEQVLQRKRIRSRIYWLVRMDLDTE